MWFSYNKNQTVFAATSSHCFRSLYDTLKTLVRHYLYMVEQEKYVSLCRRGIGRNLVFLKNQLGTLLILEKAVKLHELGVNKEIGFLLVLYI